MSIPNVSTGILESSTDVDYEYQKLISYVLAAGKKVITRNSEVTKIANYSLVFNATPLVSIRKTAWKQCLAEWEWFMSGSNYIPNLHESVRHWWKPWGGDSGVVDNNYSQQFRDFV